LSNTSTSRNSRSSHGRSRGTHQHRTADPWSNDDAPMTMPTAMAGDTDIDNNNNHRGNRHHGSNGDMGAGVRLPAVRGAIMTR
jgi:hypothetical protein